MTGTSLLSILNIATVAIACFIPLYCI